MLKAEMDDNQTFTQILSQISSLIDEAIVQFRQEGIKIVYSDRTMIAVVSLLVSKDAFKKYELDKEFNLGFNLLDLTQLFKRFKGNIAFEVTEASMIIKGVGQTRELIQKAIVLGEENIPQIENLVFKGECSVSIAQLLQALDDCALFGDEMAIKLEQDKISFFSDVTGKGEAKLEVIKGKELLSTTLTEGSQGNESRFSIAILSKVVSPMTDFGKIQMGDSEPFRIEYDIPNIKLAWIVAPRVRG